MNVDVVSLYYKIISCTTCTNTKWYNVV